MEDGREGGEERGGEGRRGEGRIATYTCLPVRSSHQWLVCHCKVQSANETLQKCHLNICTSHNGDIQGHRY